MRRRRTLKSIRRFAKKNWRRRGSFLHRRSVMKNGIRTRR